MRHPDLLRSLSDSQRKAVLEAAQTLQEAGFHCHLVGGCVRDLLLGRPVKDLDLTSEATPQQSRKLFRKTIPTGIEHGTITVRLYGHSLELTTYRTEGTYSDGRRPDEVKFGKSLNVDLSRRDFTVNALAYNPLKEDLVDEHGGLEDLKSRLIRTIGRPEDRFFEDGLRPIRACRFLSTLDFTLEPATERALSDPEVQRRTGLVAMERFTDELRKGMRAADPVPMLWTLYESGLLQVFLNRVGQVEKPQIPGHGIIPLPFQDELLAAPDNRKQLETTIQSIPDGWDWLVDIRMFLWFRFLFPELSLEKETAILRGWKFPNHTLQCFEACHLLFESSPALMGLASETDAADATVQGNYESRKLLFRLEKILSGRLEAFLLSWEGFAKLQLIPAGLPEPVIQMLIQDFRHTPFRIKDLAIGGKELMDRGIQGKALGDALQLCLQRVWANPEMNELEALLQFVEKEYQSPS
ncbi:MAG: hypothetical protein KDK25_13845 [Leptospiraceae bacterium]|nr:hypothetical protein [Leptospiraceae bacterium]MCB1171423.1 hypothetical protein [Leptospiraceae bacterium]